MLFPQSAGTKGTLKTHTPAEVFQPCSVISEIHFPVQRNFPISVSTEVFHNDRQEKPGTGENRGSYLLTYEQTQQVRLKV